MAKSSDNIFTRWQAGPIKDKFLIRNTRSGRTLVANPPVMTSTGNVIPGSRSRQDVFRQAATYAEFSRSHPIYEYKAIGTLLSAYEIAMADFLGKPQILKIDIRSWSGGAGEPICIEAKDNVLLVNVRLMIRQTSTSEIALEAGEARQSEEDPMLWIYTTTTHIAKESGIRLDAFAYDLPGNVGSNSLGLD